MGSCCRVSSLGLTEEVPSAAQRQGLEPGGWDHPSQEPPWMRGFPCHPLIFQVLFSIFEMTIGLPLDFKAGKPQPFGQILPSSISRRNKAAKTRPHPTDAVRSMVTSLLQASEWSLCNAVVSLQRRHRRQHDQRRTWSFTENICRLLKESHSSQK